VERGSREREATRHDLNRFVVAVHQDRRPTQPHRRLADGAAPREEIEHAIPGVGMHLDNPVDDRQRLLRRVARLLLAVRTDDGVPPSVRRRLPSLGFFRANQAWGHVGDAVNVIVPIRVILGVLRVPQDVVVLRRPSFGRPCPVVVGPDDFVDERIAPEDGIE